MIGGLLSKIFGARPAWVEGGLYATRREDGSHAVLKIFKADARGVHVRTYGNAYPQRPARIDEAALYMAGIHDGDGEHFGMGHLPVSHASFSGWGAVFVQRSIVAADELEGYEMWREAGGGYF